MNKAKKSWFVAMILLLFIIITGDIVINIAFSTSTNPTSNKTISLTNNAPIYNKAYAQNSIESFPLSQDYISDSSKNGGLSVSDSEQTWTTNTTVNIFEHNDPRVSTDGTGSANHTIAPGTENNYVFSLNNDKEYAIKYNLNISGENDSEYEIPVMVQVLDVNGNSLSGDMKSIKELNSISSDGNVKPYSSTQYQIRWKWDFENGTDDYDTFLGNKAIDEEIACHINISVISEYDYDESSVESDSSDTPSDSSTIKTSDNRNFALYIVISIFSAITIALIIIFRKKHNGDFKK